MSLFLTKDLPLELGINLVVDFFHTKMFITSWVCLYLVARNFKICHLEWVNISDSTQHYYTPVKKL